MLDEFAQKKLGDVSDEYMGRHENTRQTEQ